MIWKFLQQEYLGNSVLSYLFAAGIFLLLFLLVKLLKFVVLKRLKKWSELTKTSVDDFIILNVERFIIPILYLSAFYFGLSYLKLDPAIAKIVNSALVIIVTFFAIRFIALIINYSIRFYWKKKTESDSVEGQLKGVSGFISLIVWSIGLIFLLDNLGFEITAVVTGLGIGGIAIALAAQAVLGDLFSYFVIFFDRPFEIGDFIIVDDKMGTVEKVGIKTTRVTSLNGEQIIFSNSNLTNSRIHNYKRMVKRRVLFKIGVVYQTSIENLKDIPVIIRSIIEENEGTTFDRAHFQSYGESSLNFEIVYYVLTSEFNNYMDIQQKINYRILEEFSARGIEFAYPTRTLYLENNIIKDI